MITQVFGRRVEEHLGGRILDGAVHALGLAVGPGAARLGQPMRDAVFQADAIERMSHRVVLGGGVVGERHAVIGEHLVSLAGGKP